MALSSYFIEMIFKQQNLYKDQLNDKYSHKAVYCCKDVIREK